MADNCLRQTREQRKGRLLETSNTRVLAETWAFWEWTARISAIDGFPSAIVQRTKKRWITEDCFCSPRIGVAKRARPCRAVVCPITAVRTRQQPPISCGKSQRRGLRGACGRNVRTDHPLHPPCATSPWQALPLHRQRCFELEEMKTGCLPRARSEESRSVAGGERRGTVNLEPMFLVQSVLHFLVQLQKKNHWPGRKEWGARTNLILCCRAGGTIVFA